MLCFVYFVVFYLSFWLEQKSCWMLIHRGNKLVVIMWFDRSASEKHQKFKKAHSRESWENNLEDVELVGWVGHLWCIFSNYYIITFHFFLHYILTRCCLPFTTTFNTWDSPIDPNRHSVTNATSPALTHQTLNVCAPITPIQVHQ